jgi:hypothetical protein
MPFSLWWVGLALSLMGFVLLAVTTVFELSIIPQRIRPYAFWAALLLFMTGVSLSVIFT